MAIQTIATFLNWFKKRAKPTAAQFADLFDSFAHKTRDFDQMGGGLKPHNPNRPYTQGEAMYIGGKIRIAKTDLAIGAYSAGQWTDFTGDAQSLGLTAWTPEEEIVYDAENPIQRTHRLAILEALTDSQGIEPFVDPDWEEFWVVVVYTEGGYIPLYPGGGFVKNNRVYSYQLDAAPKGFYRTNRSDVGFDGGFKSTNFAAELANGDWVLEATLSKPRVNTYDGPPELTDNSSLGFETKKSRWIDSTTQIEYLFISESGSEAFWFPLQGTIENPIGGLVVTGGFSSAKLAGRRDNLRYSVSGNIVTISGPVEFVITNLASGGTIEIPIPNPLNIASGGDYGMVYSFRKNVFYTLLGISSILGELSTGLLLLTFGNSPTGSSTDKIDFTATYQTNFEEF